MSHTLWKRLCSNEVPDKLAAVAARARNGLEEAWASVPPNTRAELEQKLADETLSEDVNSLLRMLMEVAPAVYQAAINVRGLAILVATVSGQGLDSTAAHCAGEPRAVARGVGRAEAGPPDNWRGVPFRYEDCGPQWLAVVSAELTAHTSQ